MRRGWLVGIALGLLSGCSETTEVTDAGSTDVVATDVVTTDVVTTDVAPDVTRSCVVGMACGNECYPSDAPCSACGTLRYDADCRCRASAGACAPATGCDNPAPAGVGEFCGTYAWCNRPCAAGLTCTGMVARDGGATSSLDYRRLCEVPADASVAPSFPVPAPLTPSRACGTLTCAAGQVCVLGCSGGDAGAIDLHRCVDVPSACRGAASCPCASVCGAPSGGAVDGEVRCTGCS